ncbi:helix-turn-helix transcriptional regulator [Streptomyces triculaminicus]|uniref:Helix-turn-helix transcriptional regulator n=2 Tax=Streptomyces TaxID=1883 RepID=A0A939FKE3_9ACTN|nr:MULTISPECIES: TetR/AcrR family transcriptional regulator [Streptomyces]MBO0652892.1 helix-turn-helix transcriptional regulator [Streptomyces triculaminicus]QSY51390.1 helix-turn-helix transcriptional regulator [Streptomyces griseocarneus]
MTPPGQEPEPSKSRQRRERERAETRTEILQAARELARAEGWEAVSMRRLADRIGYSANYAYRYFKGRDDILLAFVKDGFVRLAGIMRSGGTSVQAAAAAYLDFALDEPDVYQVMYGLGGVHVPAADTVTEGAAVGAVIADALGIADPNDDRIARIWATAHGLAALHAIRKLPVDRAHLHRLLAASVDDLLRAPRQPEGDAR